MTNRLNRRPHTVQLIFAVSCFATTLLGAAQSAFAAVAVPTLSIGGKATPFVVPPYFGSDRQVYAPVDFVRLLGASYLPQPDQQIVVITAASGAKISSPYQLVGGRYCVCVSKVAADLGASVGWQSSINTLTLRARLEMVRQDPTSLTIYTSYPIYYTVGHLKSPNRLFVDLNGVDLAAAPASIPATNAFVGQIRSGQMTFNTTRIVIDLKRQVGFNVISGMNTNRVEVALCGGASTPARPVIASVPTPMPVAPIAPLSPVVTQPTITNVPPPLVVPPAESTPSVTSSVRITGLSYKVADDGQFQVQITTNGAAKYRTETLRNPSRLAFDLAGATLDDSVQRMLSVDDPIIKAIRAGILTTGENKFGRVVVDMAHMVDYSIVPRLDSQGTTYILTLNRPSSAPTIAPMPEPATPSVQIGSNDLHGKIVVIDPGHGADDTGAIGIGGLREKDLNLSIGLKVADVLTAAGAIVHMTRTQDIKPSVGARPQMAIAWGADYFISIHCDDSGAPNSHSGTTVYFHAQNQTCRRMASDIVNRIALVSGIPALGVKSDTIRFQTGFGVLRGSPMPAVLVECGYMNNIKDLQKLCDLQNQQRIAEAIVAGLRDFVAERTASR